MKKRLVFIAYHALFIVIYGLSLVLLLALDINAASAQIKDESWSVGYSQGPRTSNYTDCDATSELLFFAYDTGNLVDVYNHSGVFQFTLFFEDFSKGALQIRCDEYNLYVNTKKGTVFIFFRDQLVDSMSSGDAREIGYGPSWFQSMYVWADKDNVYQLNNNGEWIPFCKTPDVVCESLPMIWLRPEQERVAIIIGVTALFVFGWGYIVVQIISRKKTDYKSYRLGP